MTTKLIASTRHGDLPVCDGLRHHLADRQPEAQAERVEDHEEQAEPVDENALVRCSHNSPPHRRLDRRSTCSVRVFASDRSSASSREDDDGGPRWCWTRRRAPRSCGRPVRPRLRGRAGPGLGARLVPRGVARSSLSPTGLRPEHHPVRPDVRPAGAPGDHGSRDVAAAGRHGGPSSESCRQDWSRTPARCCCWSSASRCRRHSAAYPVLLCATGALGFGFGTTVPALNTFAARLPPVGPGPLDPHAQRAARHGHGAGAPAHRALPRARRVVAPARAGRRRAGRPSSCSRYAARSDAGPTPQRAAGRRQKLPSRFWWYAGAAVLYRRVRDALRQLVQRLPHG